MSALASSCWLADSEVRIAIAFKSFVRPICEYGNVAIMGAAPSHLPKLDAVQKKAEKLSDIVPFLHCILAVKLVLLACYVSYLISKVRSLYNSFVQLLPPPH